MDDVFVLDPSNYGFFALLSSVCLIDRCNQFTFQVKITTLFSSCIDFYAHWLVLKGCLQKVLICISPSTYSFQTSSSTENSCFQQGCYGSRIHYPLIFRKHHWLRKSAIILIKKLPDKNNGFKNLEKSGRAATLYYSEYHVHKLKVHGWHVATKRAITSQMFLPSLIRKIMGWNMWRMI